MIETEFELFWKGTILSWYQIIQNFESKLALNENRYLNRIIKLRASKPYYVLYMMRCVIRN